MIDGWRIVDAERPLGQGGFGVVYRAVHADLGLAVALKVMTHPSWSEPEGRRAFRDEVRAMGRLEHPSVVRVLDHGEVRAGGALPAGAPWLAMELVDGGSLAAASLGGWGALRAVVEQILDALAHAHARGLVHGDVSPANVLLDPAGPARLTDFGLARAIAAESRPGSHEGLVRGTRPYMAPEQRQGRFRDVGPWTDLFALGALVWERVTGAPPRHSPPGAFVPVVAVPAGLEVWLRRCLEPSPAARWAWAADARRALPDGSTADGRMRGTPGAPTAVPIGSGVAPPPTVTAGTTAEGTADEATSAARVVRSPAPPLPETGRPAGRSVEPVAVQWLRMGGGRAGLFGLRRLPFLGRDAERDLLWAALTEVVTTGKPAAVVISGPSGVGKTRLARWLAERAHEVGAALAVEVTHGSGPSDGLPGMVRRVAVLGGLDTRAAQARLGPFCASLGATDPWDAEVLAAVATDAPVAAVDRRLAARRLVERLAAGRPVVLVVDDAPLGLEALGIAERLLSGAQPVLVLVTASDEALAERPAAAEVVGALAARARHVALGPLPAADHAVLVRELFGLAPDVAAAVEARTAGNPEFAVQLVGAWVDRGVLVRAADGYRLQAGVEAPLPEDLRASWAGRLQRFLAAEPEASGPALEIAAALGQEVDGAEWVEVAALAGVTVPEGLAERLIGAWLAARRERGFGFAHGMARVALRDRAGPRWAAWNDACARALEARFPIEARAWPVDALERAARHLEAAGRLEPARDRYAHAARERGARAEYRVALELALRVVALLADAGVPPGDEAWGRAWHTELDLRLLLGQYDVAAPRIGAAVAHAEAHGWGAARGWLLRDRAQERGFAGDVAASRADMAVALGLFRRHGDRRGQAFLLQLQGDDERGLGDIEASAGLYREAAELGERAGARDMVGVALVSLGGALMELGRYAEAEEAVAEALLICEETHASVVAAYGTYFLAAIRGHRGALEEADRLARDALARLERIGNPYPLMFCRVVLANVDRLSGRLERAAATLADIVVYGDGMGLQERWEFQAELARVRLAEGRVAEARALAAEVLDHLDEAPPMGALLAGLVGAVAALRAGDGEGAAAALVAARAGVARSGQRDPEKARQALEAAALAEAQGHASIAASARELAGALEPVSAARPARPAAP